MKTMRPVSLIRHELSTAKAFRTAYVDHPATDRFAREMVKDNENEIADLRRELAEALSADLEVSLDGRPVEDHRVSLPYFNRVTQSLQAAYRAIFRSLTADGSLKRGDAILAIAGTGPGSFRVTFKAPPEQLDLLNEPMTDRAMVELLTLLRAGERGDSDAPRVWIERADESAVRAMIRVAASLAGSHGRTSFRWRSASGAEEIVSLTAERARELATSLAGALGREIVHVIGHLSMASDDPPRVKVRTDDDEFIADVVAEELLDVVKDVLFGQIRATIVIDMTTSPTTGQPKTKRELIDLEPA